MTDINVQLAMKVLYLHLTGIPCLLDRLDPADVGDAAVQERAGLANKHAQSQRRPVRLCRGQRGERWESQEVGDRGRGGGFRGRTRERKGNEIRQRGRAGQWTTAVGDEERRRAGQKKSGRNLQLGVQRAKKMKVLTQGQLGGNNSNIKEADITKDSGLACCCLWETAGQKKM